MAREQEPIFSWDPETGVAMCILSDGINSYHGYAKCRDEDRDLMSEKTGCYIAEGRARINYLTHLRDNRIKPQYDILHELYFSINQSIRYNENSYEARMIKKKLDVAKFELDAVRDMIASEKSTLKEYMRQKAILYKKVRENRSGQK